MAGRKKSRRKIRVRRKSRGRGIKGLGMMKGGGGAAIVGSSLSLGTTLAIRAVMKPTPSKTSKVVYENAPFIGGGVGLVSALGYLAIKRKDAAMMAGASTVVTSLGLFALDKVAKKRAQQAAAPAAGDATAEELTGLGNVVVPELGSVYAAERLAGLGRNRQSRGHTVDIGAGMSGGFGRG